MGIDRYYLVNCKAYKNNGDFTILQSIHINETKEGAEGVAYSMCAERYPRRYGYKSYRVDVSEIPQDMVDAIQSDPNGKLVQRLSGLHKEVLRFIQETFNDLFCTSSEDIMGKVNEKMIRAGRRKIEKHDIYGNDFQAGKMYGRMLGERYGKMDLIRQIVDLMTDFTEDFNQENG